MKFVQDALLPQQCFRLWPSSRPKCYFIMTFGQIFLKKVEFGTVIKNTKLLIFKKVYSNTDQNMSSYPNNAIPSFKNFERMPHSLLCSSISSFSVALPHLCHQRR